MEQLKKGVRTVATTGLAVLMCLVLLWLLLLSIFNTYYTDVLENRLALHGNVTVSVLGILAVIALFIAGNRLRGRIKMPSRAACDKITVVCAVLAALYAVAVQPIPLYDQFALLNIAKEMHAGDFSAFFPGGYAEMFPNQRGLILFYYLMQFIVGGNNYIVMQLLNAVSLLVIWRCMYRLAEAWFGDGICARLVSFAMPAFLPLTLYVTFVYGNLYGLALSLAAFVMLERWFSQRKWKYIAAGGILMALAIQAKSNYSICLVAYILFLLLEAIVQHTDSYVSVLHNCLCASIALPLVLTLCGNLGVDAAMYAITGIEKSKGTPTSAWVAMGLQEDPVTEVKFPAPGAYNTYNDSTYRAANYDTAQANAIATEYIQRRVGEFVNNPAGAARFFSRKTAAQWTEPTFESLVIQTGRPNNVSLAPWYTALCTQGSTLEQTLWTVYDVFQGIIYFGALACFITRLRRGEVFQWTLAVTFLGGFLFHMIWEAKAQYTLFHFVLLIPYAVQGYADCARAISARPVRSAGVCACTTAAMLLFTITPLRDAVALERNGDKEWFRNTAIWRGPVLATGDYVITCNHGDISIPVHLQATQTFSLNPFYYIITYEGRPIAAAAEQENAQVSLAPAAQGSTYSLSYWILIRADFGDKYYIDLISDSTVYYVDARSQLAITCQGDTLTLEPSAGAPAQTFQIVKDDGAHS